MNRGLINISVWRLEHLTICCTSFDLISANKPRIRERPLVLNRDWQSVQGRIKSFCLLIVVFFSEEHPKFLLAWWFFCGFKVQTFQNKVKQFHRHIVECLLLDTCYKIEVCKCALKRQCLLLTSTFLFSSSFKFISIYSSNLFLSCPQCPACLYQAM